MVNILYQASENTGRYCFWLAEILTNTSPPLRSQMHEPSLTRIIVDFPQKNFSQSHICFGRQGEGGFRYWMVFKNDFMFLSDPTYGHHKTFWLLNDFIYILINMQLLGVNSVLRCLIFVIKFIQVLCQHGLEWSIHTW